MEYKFLCPYDDCNHRKFRLPQQAHDSPEKEVSDKVMPHLEDFASYLNSDDEVENDVFITLDLDSDDAP